MVVPKKILFVEDEEHLRNVIQLNLDLEGYKVECAGTGEDAIQKFNKNHYDFILLDVMLPEIDGYQVCEHIRLRDKNVPIMFLSARSSVEERKKGLRLGADDYLPKPFDLEELLLRVARLIKRVGQNEVSEVPDSVQIGIACADLVNYQVKSVDRTQVLRELTQKEVMFLRLLIRRKGEAVTRAEILEIVWGKEQLPSTRTVDNFIVQFRKDFEPNTKEPQYFKSIHGVGYRLILD